MYLESDPNIVVPIPTTASPCANPLPAIFVTFRILVSPSQSETYAVVPDWDADTRILKVTNVGGVGFAEGESVVGIGTTLLGSDSEYIVRSVSDQDEYDNYNENIVVESEADSIIDFTEDNPFGDF